MKYWKIFWNREFEDWNEQQTEMRKIQDRIEQLKENQVLVITLIEKEGV